MIRTSILLATLLAFLSGPACLPREPDADGKALAETHKRMLDADELTTDRMVADINKREARHETPEAKRKFRDAYQEGMAPARGKLASLFIREAGRKTGQTLKKVGEDLGEGFREFTRGLGESMEDMQKNGGFNDRLKDFGREMGKTIRDITESVEAVADGVQDELSKEE
ncbi:MAG: hypothetical protein AAF449_25635 [Myxococcota bacterium]